MPKDYPERGEAGTLPTPVITSLAGGIGYLRRLGLDAIRSHHKKLFARLAEQLSGMANYRVICPDHAGAVLSFVRGDVSCDRIGTYLAEHGICVRTGYHCAPMAHHTLGTEDGTVRVSFGVFNTIEEVDTLCRTLRRMDFCHEVTPL
jgi:selenocysteine lyase/cysteine desulfurase